MTIVETLRQPRSTNCLFSDETPCGPTAVAALALCEEGSCQSPASGAPFPSAQRGSPSLLAPSAHERQTTQFFLARGVRFAFFWGKKIDCPRGDSKLNRTISTP